jgi:hypothetical protein
LFTEAGCLATLLFLLSAVQIVPSSLVRRLALRKLRLTDEEDEDDDNDNLAIAAAKGVLSSSTKCWSIKASDL